DVLLGSEGSRMLAQQTATAKPRNAVSRAQRRSSSRRNNPGKPAVTPRACSHFVPAREPVFARGKARAARLGRFEQASRTQPRAKKARPERVREKAARERNGNIP